MDEVDNNPWLQEQSILQGKLPHLQFDLNYEHIVLCNLENHLHLIHLLVSVHHHNTDCIEDIEEEPKD